MRNPHKASNVNDKNERQHRFTPRWLIAGLHAEFNFTMDACGHPLSPASQIIGRGFTLVKGHAGHGLEVADCYNRSWARERVFLQPDFARVEEAVLAAGNAIMAPKPAECIVLLMPWNRQEQPFWQDWIEPWRDRSDRQGRPFTLHTRAIRGRVKYGSPSDPEGKLAGSPNFGSGLVIWQRI